jgi:hypothetical protein
MWIWGNLNPPQIKTVIPFVEKCWANLKSRVLVWDANWYMGVLFLSDKEDMTRDFEPVRGSVRYDADIDRLVMFV